MAKHLDEIKGKQIPVWQQANPYYVEDTPYPTRVQTKQKSSSTKSNHYKPSKSTKRGDIVETGEYEVNKGDSLWKIAQQHGTTVDALRKANPEIKGNMIQAGQIINLGSTSNSNNSKQTTTSNNNSSPKDTKVDYKGTIFKDNKSNTKTTTKTTTTKNNTNTASKITLGGKIFDNKTNITLGGKIYNDNNVSYQNQPNFTYNKQRQYNNLLQTRSGRYNTNESNENLYNYINDVNDTPAISRLRHSLIFGRPSVKIKAKRLQNTKPVKSNTNK